ncbi:MAG: hypothetical protein IT306_12970 [Chloroflexi bacterium]|nr:hypothetical protein [Chloroflexota bacterium]
MIECDAGVLGREAPVDGLSGGVALGDPGCDLLLKGLTVWQTAVEALTGENAQFDLTEPKMIRVLSGTVAWTAARPTVVR